MRGQCGNGKSHELVLPMEVRGALDDYELSLDEEFLSTDLSSQSIQPRARVVVLPPTMKPQKANWTARQHELWVRLVMQEVINDNKPGTILNNEGKNLVSNFHSQSRIYYTWDQHKNHWENTKKEYYTWRWLKAQTGKGWDPNRGTIQMEDSWWKENATAYFNLEKFKHEPLQFAVELEVIFAGSMAEGDLQVNVSIGSSIAWNNSKQSTSSHYNNRSGSNYVIADDSVDSREPDGDDNSNKALNSSHTSGVK